MIALATTHPSGLANPGSELCDHRPASSLLDMPYAEGLYQTHVFTYHRTSGIPHSILEG